MPKYRWKTQSSNEDENKKPRSKEIPIFTGLILLLLILSTGLVSATTVTYFNGSSSGTPGQPGSSGVNTSVTTALPTITANVTTMVNVTTQIPTVVTTVIPTQK